MCNSLIFCHTQKQLDVALGKMCKTFTPVNYERLLTAYRYLGKTQIAMDQLIIHFMTAINHESFSVLLDHNGVNYVLKD